MPGIPMSPTTTTRPTNTAVRGLSEAPTTTAAEEPGATGSAGAAPATTSPAPQAASAKARPSTADVRGARARAAASGQPVLQAITDKLGDLGQLSGPEALERVVAGALANAGHINQLKDAGAGALRDQMSKADWDKVNEVTKQVVDQLADRATATWSPREQQALKNVMGTLDELAGGDGKLNHGDKLAVTNAILRDTPGIINTAFQEIDKRLPRGGLVNRLAKRLVGNAFTPTRRTQRRARRGLPYRPGPIQRMRDNRQDKILGLARAEANKQFNQAFQQLGVSPETRRHFDGQRRDLTIAQVIRFSEDLKVLQGRFQQGGNPVAGGRLKEVAGQLAEHVRVEQQPLRNGVPSPYRADALASTLLDTLEGVSLKPRN
jgi:hypothetical protein